MKKQYQLFCNEEINYLKFKLDIINLRFISKLNLSNKTINNNELDFIFKYNNNNLVYLNLDNNNISNEGVTFLRNKS